MSRKQKAVGIISLAQILYLETRKEEDKRREGPSTISAPQSATGLPSRAGPDKVLPPDSEEGPLGPVVLPAADAPVQLRVRARGHVAEALRLDGAELDPEVPQLALVLGRGALELADAPGLLAKELDILDDDGLPGVVAAAATTGSGCSVDDSGCRLVGGGTTGRAPLVLPLSSTPPPPPSSSFSFSLTLTSLSDDIEGCLLWSCDRSHDGLKGGPMRPRASPLFPPPPPPPPPGNTIDDLPFRCSEEPLRPAAADKEFPPVAVAVAVVMAVVVLLAVAAPLRRRRPPPDALHRVDVRVQRADVAAAHLVRGAQAPGQVVQALDEHVAAVLGYVVVVVVVVVVGRDDGGVGGGAGGAGGVAGGVHVMAAAVDLDLGAAGQGAAAGCWRARRWRVVGEDEEAVAVVVLLVVVLVGATVLIVVLVVVMVIVWFSLLVLFGWTGRAGGAAGAEGRGVAWPQGGER
ncbi:hypothetical protein VSDG_00824 [Cytospora chrysosperma]|uniref:Uncharacterized protein n=1 Tax=Cytospora chrysosperma TaxID=252740 RepID=A0A423WL87_CYTCH|nr:hypothetical protein VSDG_00824 [Valsa sordida]